MKSIFDGSRYLEGTERVKYCDQKELEGKVSLYVIVAFILLNRLAEGKEDAGIITLTLSKAKCHHY